MKRRIRFALDTPAGNVRTGLLLLVPLALFGGFWWTIAHSLAILGTALVPSRFDVWVMLAAMWALAVGWRSARLLSRGLHVFGKLQCPSALVRSWRSRVYRDFAWHFGLALLATAGLYAAPGAPSGLFVALAVVAGAGLLALLLGAYTFGYWTGVVKEDVSVSRAKSFGIQLKTWVTGQAVRYVNLDLAQESAQEGRLPHQRWVRNWVYPAFPVLLWALLPFRTNWGDGVTTLHLMYLGFAVAASGPILMMRDLHWRYLLLPGGTSRGAFGRRIFVSTVVYQAGLWTAVAGGYWFMKSVWMGVPFATVAVQSATANLATLFEFMAACALTGALRAMGRVYPFLFAWLFLIAVSVYAGEVHGRFNAVLFTSGPMYVAALLALTVAAVLLADRLWTTRKLMPQML